MAGAREGHLVELFTEAGLREIESSVLTVRVEFADFDKVVGAVHAGCRPGR